MVLNTYYRKSLAQIFAFGKAHHDNARNEIIMVGIIHFLMHEFLTITRLIPNFADRVDDPPASAEDQNTICAIFDNIFGQSAQYIQPIIFRSGTLHVYAQAAVWGQHILHRQTTIKQRCESAGIRLEDIKVKVDPESSNQLTTSQPIQPNYDVNKASEHLQRLAAQLNDNKELQSSIKRLIRRMQTNQTDRQE